MEEGGKIYLLQKIRAEKAKKEYIIERRGIIENGKLENVIPIWHEDWESILKSEKNERLNPYQYTLVTNVKLDKLIELLGPNYSVRFFPKKLFHSSGIDKRAVHIIDAWAKKQPILPPIIKVGKNDNLIIEDGCHRINCAINLGCKSIPIVFLDDLTTYLSKSRIIEEMGGNLVISPH